MRKLAFTIKNLITLIFLIYQIQFAAGQEFGRLPLKECWKIPDNNISSLSIASDNVQDIYLTNTDSTVEAIDETSGKTIWRSDIGGEIVLPAMSDAQRVIIVSKNQPLDNSGTETENEISIELTFRSLSSLTGITNWQKSFPLSKAENVFLFDDSDKIFAVTESGRLLVLGKQNGRIYLEQQLDLKFSALPFFQDNKIYIPDKDNKIHVVSLLHGQIIHSINTPGIPKSILNGNNTIFVGGQTGNISALDLHSSKINWKTWTGAEITNITKVPRGILVSSFDNYIYLLSEKNGRRIWKRRLSGRTVGKPLIKDNVAVYAILGGTDAVFIELDKGKLINQISIQPENFFVDNPKGVGDLVLFPTYQGLFAYSAENKCLNNKQL